MAKKIKLPLAMANGVTVRTLEELQENWDLAKIVEYYHNGKLVTWLNDRYYTDIVDQINKLNEITDSQELQKKLCEIFGVEFTEKTKVDVQAITERDKKYSELRKITADDTILKNDDKVAFTQNELQEMIDKKEPVIYLVPNSYVIPINLKNITLIGIGGGVTLQVFSDHYIDYEKQNVTFKNIKFDEAYWAIALPEERKKLEILADEKYEIENYAIARDFYQRAAKLGSGHAYNRLGNIFENGEGVPVNLETAYNYYQNGSQLSNGRASNNLGRFYAEGKFVKSDGKTALSYYKKAIEAIDEKLDDIPYYNIGILYLHGLAGMEKNTNLAIKNIKIAAEHGYAYALYVLGLIYSTGDIVNKDIDKALTYYSEAGQKGEPSGYDEIGILYRDGNGVAQDLDKAVNFFKKAGEKGCAKGYLHLGLMYGDEELPDKYSLYPENGIKWLKKAGEAGLAEGYYFIGLYHYSNQLSTHEPEKAVEWYEKAANMGMGDACWMLGRLFTDDVWSPLKKDGWEGMLDGWVKAEEWWNKGIDLVNTKCIYEMADRYLEGRKYVEEKDKDINTEMAFELYTKGAELDEPWCMRGLSIMYFHGIQPAEQDFSKALEWIDRAIDIKPDTKSYTDLRDEIINAENPQEQETTNSDSSCFITTAVCSSLNKPDDCDELMTMRWLRDKLKDEDTDMAALIEEYYRVAPLVVKKIDSTADAPMVYRRLWDGSISKIYNDIKHKDYQNAKLRYIAMLEGLCVRYDEPLAPGIKSKIEKVRLYN